MSSSSSRSLLRARDDAAARLRIDMDNSGPSSSSSSSSSSSASSSSSSLSSSSATSSSTIAVNGGGAAKAPPGGRVRVWEASDATWRRLLDDEALGAGADIAETLLRRRRLADASITGAAMVRRSVNRHVFLVIDAGRGMDVHDLKPLDRRTATRSLVEHFIGVFFDRNPISQLGIIVTCNGLAHLVSPLSSNPSRHVDALRASSRLVGGVPSLQNALEQALASLMYAPRHGSREVICIFGSISTRDPRNVYDTIESARKAHVRCSMVALGGETHVFRELTRVCRGRFEVPLDIEHYRDLVLDFATPPPADSEDASPTLVPTGFPTLHSAALGVCACHNAFSVALYECPRCRARVCEIPAECAVCSLALVSSAHLVRSTMHLVPLARFSDGRLSAQEKHGNDADDDDDDDDDNGNQKSSRHTGSTALVAATAATRKRRRSSSEHALECAGCMRSSASTPPVPVTFVCPRCDTAYCTSCDMFLHDSLHVCIGCEMKRQ